MNFLSIIITILGLSLFELVSSIDNAIINAEVLGTISAKGRKWFLFWGLIIAVVLVRGLLPWLIVWATVPSLGPWGALTAALSSDPAVSTAVEQSAPILLAGGGVFLLFLFFHWLFLEQKNIGLRHESFFLRQGIWFYAVGQLTVGNIERIKKYKFLKNGAMYSILCLGCVMLFDAFGVHTPSWVSPLVTFAVVGYFLVRSRNEIATLAL